MVYHRAIVTSFGLPKKNTIKNLLKNANRNLNKMVTLVAISNLPPHHCNNFCFTKKKKKKHYKTIYNNLKLVNANSKINVEINCFLKNTT
jgi:hypothetical protein